MSAAKTNCRHGAPRAYQDAVGGGGNEAVQLVAPLSLTPSTSSLLHGAHPQEIVSSPAKPCPLADMSGSWFKRNTADRRR
jgi:hypothetical protein